MLSLYVNSFDINADAIFETHGAPPHTSGVQFAGLIDFDNDGMPELVVVSVEPLSGEIIARVDRFTDGRVELLYWGGMWFGNNWNTIRIMSASDGRKFLVNEFGGRALSFSYYTLENGIWVQVMSRLRTNLTEIIYYDDTGWGDELRYYVNDVLVDEQTFNNAPVTELGIAGVVFEWYDLLENPSSVHAVLAQLAAG